MTELKIKGDEFYVVDAGNVKAVFDNLNDAVESLKGVASTLSPDKAGVFAVNMKGKNGQWEVKGVSWAQIAIELMKKGK